MRQVRRIAAYGRCRDDAGRVLLNRASAGAEVPGAWRLPGGGILHGEHPADAVVREFAEDTGLQVAVTGLCAVVSDVLPWRGVARHTDRVIYDVAMRGGAPQGAVAGAGHRLAWLTREEAAGLPVMPFTAELLGLPVASAGGAGGAPAGQSLEPEFDPEFDPEPVRLPVDPAVLGPAVDPSFTAVPSGGPGPDSDTSQGGGAPYAAPPAGQRFAAYGLVTDEAGRVLLTLIADGFPGAGHWHLPGGGTDHGEQPAAGFLRELAEEAGQVGRLIGLLDVSHRRSLAVGPEGYPLDWHAVRVLYRAVVDAPTEARVTEAAGGSTARAAWFPAAQARAVPLTEIAAVALSGLAGGEDVGEAGGEASAHELHS